MAYPADPLETAELTRRIVTEYFDRTGISILSWTPYPEHKHVAALVHQKIKTFNTDGISPAFIDRVATTSIDMAAMAYGHTHIDVQVYVALSTLLTLCVDDQAVKPEALEQFVYRLNTGSPQLHPILDHLVENMQNASKHFPPYAASAIFTNTIQHINSVLLDVQSEKMPLSSESLPFIVYKRARSGLGEVYGFFIWDIYTFPDVSPYVQTVVDVDMVLAYINDLFSFYKEAIGGDTDTFIHDRAVATGKSAAETLSTVLDDIVACIERIRQLLKGDKERAVWEQFLTSYTAFHYYTSRYRVEELTNSKYANPDIKGLI